jgi:hypothetical protein
VEEVGNVGREHESLSSKCEIEDENCEDTDDTHDRNGEQRLVELDFRNDDNVINVLYKTRSLINATLI